jgi:hypothetical protein
MDVRSGRAPVERTRSRWNTSSPAIFPRVQVACSTTSISGDLRRATIGGTPPALTTSADDPAAIFVSAQQASHWRVFEKSKI